MQRKEKKEKSILDPFNSKNVAKKEKAKSEPFKFTFNPSQYMKDKDLVVAEEKKKEEEEAKVKKEEEEEDYR